MMHDSPSWAVERRVFPLDEEKRLVEALAARKIEFHEFVGHEFQFKSGVADVTIPRGSCYFVREMSRGSNWLSDIWGRPEQFDCTSYFPRYGQHLVNGGGRFMSLGELCWTHPEVVTEFGDSQGRLFARPDDGFKSFEGALVSSSGFDEWVKGLALLQVPSHTRILVARPSILHAEWRVQMVGGRAVASSQYRPVWQAGAPTEVLDFAHQIHREVAWGLGAYVLDIAQTPSGLKVVEVGCILCVAFYESDAGAIVDALQTIVAAAV